MSDCVLSSVSSGACVQERERPNVNPAERGLTFLCFFLILFLFSGEKRKKFDKIKSKNDLGVTAWNSLLKFFNMIFRFCGFHRRLLIIEKEKLNK